jgi:hypothetical protein
MEAGLTQIRVHELASELNVSTQEVLSYLTELGKKVRGPSTVIGVSLAARIRGRFRASRPTAGQARAEASSTAAPVRAEMRSDAGTEMAGAPVQQVIPHIGSSLFLPPVAPAPAVVAKPSGAAFANPFAVPTTAAPASSRPAPRAAAHAAPRAVVNRVAPVPPPVSQEPEPNYDELWNARGISDSDRDNWESAGLRPAEAALADRCDAAGIAPDDLGKKLSGRTALQRLRDGEATTSVWARLREAEQQPRRVGTKLTGRFQLS